MQSSGGSVGEILESYSMGSGMMEEEYSKFQQEFLSREKVTKASKGKLSKGNSFSELSVKVSQMEENSKARPVERESSKDGQLWSKNDQEEEATFSSSVTSMSPGLEGSFFGSDLLVTELQEASDAIEEMEGRVQIKLMVGEAVLKGMLNALEIDASEAVEAKEAELRKVKEQVKEKDSIVTRLISTLQRKEDELMKQVEDSTCKERSLLMDMLTEKEKVVVKVKENEKFLSSKEKELLKMAESMVELAMNLDGESRRVKQLESQLKESKEAEASKGTELLKIMEKMEELRVQSDSTVETVRKEGRLKELQMTESLADKDELLQGQLHRIEVLESAEQELRDQFQVQSEEIARLVQSGKDTSELLLNLKSENNIAADALDAKEGRLKSLQDDIELLHKQIQKLLVEKSTLAEELESQKVEIGAKDGQILMQKSALQDAEMHTQTSSLLEQHLRQEIARMSSNLREYVEAATHSLEVTLEDDKWKLECQSGIVMETAKGMVADLSKEIDLLGQALAENQNETIKFESKILQKSHAELISLRSSKASLEGKLEEFNVIIKSYEESTEEKGVIMEGTVQRLRQAEDTIRDLEEKMTQKRLLVQKYEGEVQEMKSHEESMKKQQNLAEENALLLREAENRIAYLGQEVAVKEVIFEKVKKDLEEKSWRVEFEEKFLTTYVESYFLEVSKQMVETQRELVNVQEKLISCLSDLEVARADLSESKLEVEMLKTEIVASAKFVDQLRTDVKGYVTVVSQASVDLEEAQLETKTEKLQFRNEVNEKNQLREKFEALLSKTRDEVSEAVKKLDESEWKSRTQSGIILGLVEGATQERIQEFAQLKEELKVKHQEVLSLRSDFEQQNLKLTSYVSILSSFKSSLLSNGQELSAFRKEMEMASATQKDALMQEQSGVREALKEIEDLKKLKLMLVARKEEENQRVHELEAALAEQKWKHQFDLDVVSTVLWEGGVEIGATWNKDRATLLSDMAQLREVLGRENPSHKLEDPKHSSRYVQNCSDVLAVESHSVSPRKNTAVEESKGQDCFKMSLAEPNSLTSLARQNSELRREKEQLLEQKTDEIYKLKRQFYKELEKVKEDRKNDSDVGSLRRDLIGSVFKSEEETAQSAKVSAKALTSETLTDGQKRDPEVKGGWTSEKSSLLQSISQRDERIKERDERIKDVSIRLSDALEKERKYVSSRASLVENLAALEKERNRLNSVHEREKEKLIAYYKKMLDEKDSDLSRAIKDIEEKDRQIAELDGASRHSMDEIGVLRVEMMTIREQLESNLAGQIQALVASSQQLGTEIAQKTKQYNLRLEGAESLIKYLLRQFSMLSLSETDYLQNVHNLRKAETEVDLLGDEVDALMDILEKVYKVLNHYSPVIQHYPGLAELVKVVKQEVLQRISYPND